MKDPQSEAFHQIANYAFFERNFSDFGLHYFNMQVDFYYSLLRRFYPAVLTQTLRATVRSFVKETNLDTYRWLCEIYDFVSATNPQDHVLIRAFARELRSQVDEASRRLLVKGERILRQLETTYEERGEVTSPLPPLLETSLSFAVCRPAPYRTVNDVEALEFVSSEDSKPSRLGMFGVLPAPIPYDEFMKQLGQPAEKN